MNLGIYEDAERLALRYDTRDPFELLDAMHVVLEFSDSFEKTGLKGFCTVMNKTRYVVINGKLSSVEKRVVAAHEAGHLIRHASDLQIGAFKDNDIYMATGKKEREANVFAADFLIQDEDVLKRIADVNSFNCDTSDILFHIMLQWLGLKHTPYIYFIVFLFDCESRRILCDICILQIFWDFCHSSDRSPDRNQQISGP